MPTAYNYIAANKTRSLLLVGAFLVIVVALGWVVGQLTGDASFLFIAGLLAIVMSLVGYFSGDKIALAVSGAKPVTREQAPYVYRMVENLCLTGGLPVPKVYVIPDPTINAFATGRDPQHASVAVTTGAIERLENEELEGVLAHELSHVKNLDVRFMTLVAVLAGVVVLLADLFWRSHWFGIGGRRSGSDRGGGALMILGLVLLIFAPLIAQLIRFAASRRRELLADASGALLTRYPDGLAKALEKIQQVNTQPMAGASNATAHLFIANPFGRAARGMSGLFNTHPPIGERVKALREMGADKNSK